jgi:hypothetical protein
MPRTLVLADSTVGRAHALPPAFHCSWADGGPVVDGDIRSVEPSVQALKRLVEEEPAS